MGPGQHQGQRRISGFQGDSPLHNGYSRGGLASSRDAGVRCASTACAKPVSGHTRCQQQTTINAPEREGERQCNGHS